MESTQRANDAKTTSLERRCNNVASTSIQRHTNTIRPLGWGLIICFWLARRGSTFGFHLLRHTVELAMSTRLCLSL